MLAAQTVFACAPADDRFGIHLDSLEARSTAAGVSVRARQEINLSHEAREALRHGVPLRFRIDLALRSNHPGGQSGSENQSFDYEIRYLPLSDHYQLSALDTASTPRTYPRLRHVLAALRDIELQFSGTGGEAGPYLVRMRSQLDRSAMPGPMQIPMLLSADWDLDSGWVEQEFTIGG